MTELRMGKELVDYGYSETKHVLQKIWVGIKTEKTSGV